MQDILQDFFIWLLKFLAVSASLLIAARVWTIRQRKRFKSSEESRGLHPANKLEPWKAEESWTANPWAIGMCQVLMILAVAMISLSWAYHSNSRKPLIFGAIGVLAIVGFGSIRFRKANQYQLTLKQHREFGDFLEFASLAMSEPIDLQTALCSAVEIQRSQGSLPIWLDADDILRCVDLAFRRISPSVSSRFRDLKRQEAVTAKEWQSLSDCVQEELWHKAKRQASEVSRLGLYPLALGVIPSVCFLLVGPLTTWTLEWVSEPTPTERARLAPTSQISDVSPVDQLPKLSQPNDNSPILTAPNENDHE